MRRLRCESNTLVDDLDVLGLKGRLANEQGVAVHGVRTLDISATGAHAQNDADGPDVDFERVAVALIEENFGRDVVWRAADRLLSFARILD